MKPVFVDLRHGLARSVYPFGRFFGYRKTSHIFQHIINIYICGRKKLLSLNKKNKSESLKDLKQSLNRSIIFRWLWLYCNWSYEGAQDFRGGGGPTSRPAGTRVHQDRRGNIFLKFKNKKSCLMKLAIFIFTWESGLTS